MRIFFDSSAFVKRYVSEAGTEAVLNWCDRASEIALSGIALPEIVSVFCRLYREGRIDVSRYRQPDALLADIEDAAICGLIPEVPARSIASLETNVLRGMDAIHIGSAIAIEADVFISADQRQRDAAARAGLRVEGV